MNIMQSVSTCIRKYADFSGRASRSEFWWFMLFYVILFIFFKFVDIKIFSIFPEGDYVPTFTTTFMGALGVTNGLFGTITGVALLIPSLAVSSRRLHDVNISGWWQGLTYLVLFIDLPFSQLPVDSFLFYLPTLIMILVFIVFFIIWARKGTAGMNRYGAPTDYEKTVNVFD